jgi:hypothetical protein
MNRAKLNYVVDVGLGITFTVSVTTGLLRFTELLGIFGINYGQLAQSMPVYEMRILHDFSGLTLSILVFIHLVLHWKWIVSMTKSIFRRGGE